MSARAHPTGPARHAPRRGPRRDAGLSLVELLVAVALGAMLMAGAVTLFVNNRQTYEITNDMARLQENARFALDLMRQDIRMAGHTGCGNVVANLTNNLRREAGYVAGQASDFGSTYDNGVVERSGSNAVEGFDNGGTVWLPSGNIGQGNALLAGDGATYPAVAAGSDGITVRYVAGNRSAVTVGTPPVRYVNNEVVNPGGDIVPPTGNETQATEDVSELNPEIIVRDLTFTLSNGQAAVISDCGAGDVFLMNGDAQDGAGPLHTPTNTDTDIVNASFVSRSYAATNRAIVSPLVAARYFVRDSDAGVPTLHRSSLDPANAFGEITEALVEGVQGLQVLYGFDGRDQDRAAEVYLRANEFDDLPDPGNTGVTRVGLGQTGGSEDALTAGRHDGLAGLVSVKIGLLMVTVDQFRKEAAERQREFYDVLDQRYCSATTATNPANNCTIIFQDDGRRRRAFSTTIAVRNFQ